MKRNFATTSPARLVCSIAMLIVSCSLAGSLRLSSCWPAQVGVRRRECFGQLMGQLQDSVAKLIDVIGTVLLHGSKSRHPVQDVKLPAMALR
jgi:hypothetical protein